jgi:acetyl-CoA hydrolase
LLGYYTKDKTSGAPGKLDVAMVEATAITEDGHLILGASVGATPEIIQMADKIIIEVPLTPSYPLSALPLFLPKRVCFNLTK